jgi:hypothetical protein
MNNEITQNEKSIYEVTKELLSLDKRFKEKGIVFRVNLDTSQQDPYESKIIIDLLYDDEIVDFIEFFVYEKGDLIKEAEELKNWLKEILDETYQNLTQYD